MAHTNGGLSFKEWSRARTQECGTARTEREDIEERKAAERLITSKPPKALENAQELSSFIVNFYNTVQAGDSAVLVESYYKNKLFLEKIQTLIHLYEGQVFPSYYGQTLSKAEWGRRKRLKYVQLLRSYALFHTAEDFLSFVRDQENLTTAMYIKYGLENKAQSLQEIWEEKIARAKAKLQ